ncbi:DUF4360 domain-containing protein [Paractinoplanes rishiriensis]|uniref:DUF4360 domain-containing protein n=1 Tax=Paractinoplanes rishiriensis TaxID=1050105 RepID=A0A919MYX0_9ACTN|nr:DUF4360 domain-containing protein [Actinoplanes rishiriensis]GIE97565.1 hypothetical protein Ari01nite_50300 [Actinoplanes rishiriensis]
MFLNLAVAALLTLPAPVVVDVITLNGTGCAPGTTAISVLPDNSGFQIDHTDFRAVAGGDAPVTAFRRNCQLNLVVHVPDGWTYAISRIVHQGSLHLEPGATAVLRSLYYYAGGPLPAYRTHTFTGPLDQDWQAIDTIELEAQVFVPCGQQRNLNVNAELRVTPGDTPAVSSWIAMRALSTDVRTTYEFAWRECA